MDAAEDPHWTARKLLRAARSAALATQADGQPFAGLVTPATAADLSPLLLLSDLSEHTRQLRRDPRCALLAVGEPVDANPQTAPRLTVLASAAIDKSPDLRARYLSVHPYAEPYAGFGDFHVWLLSPTHAAFVGGFAQARKMRFADLQPDAPAIAALQQAAGAIMAHCNADHPDAMAAIAGGLGAWRMVGVDTDGCDLAIETADQPVRRVAWDRPATTPEDVRRELIILARRGRKA